MFLLFLSYRKLLQSAYKFGRAKLESVGFR